MARKERDVTLRVVFTMGRAGESKSDDVVWTTMLKRFQTVLGEKYDVIRLEVLHGDVALTDNDMIYLAGERFGDNRGRLFGYTEPPEEEEEPEPEEAEPPSRVVSEDEPPEDDPTPPPEGELDEAAARDAEADAEILRQRDGLHEAEDPSTADLPEEDPPGPIF